MYGEDVLKENVSFVEYLVNAFVERRSGLWIRLDGTRLKGTLVSPSTDVDIVFSIELSPIKPQLNHQSPSCLDY